MTFHDLYLRDQAALLASAIEIQQRTGWRARRTARKGWFAFDGDRRLLEKGSGSAAAALIKADNYVKLTR